LIEIKDTNLNKLAAQFAAAGHRLYLVGGWVRNALLGLPPGDTDVASDVLGDDLTFLEGFTVTPVNKRLGTVLIKCEGFEAEYTCFRSESYAGGHSPESVELCVPMEKDARRRDFAVNALYLDILSGEVLDPTGRGLEDISLRRLRSTTEDPDHIMRDDGLRLLRLARFSAEMGLHIDKELFLSAKRNAALIEEISPERVFAEMNKILLSDTKYGNADGPRRGLLVLKAAGVLFRIIPELGEADGVKQDIGRAAEFHKYTVLFHIINTVRSIVPELSMRWAALFHDIAKPRMLKETGRFVGHDKAGAPMAYDILMRLRAPKALAEEVAQIVRIHMYDCNGYARESKVRKFAATNGRNMFLKFIDFRDADTLGSGKPVAGIDTAARFREIYAKMCEEGAPFSMKEVAVTGGDIMRELRLPPSPQIGRIMDMLFMHAAMKPQDNTKERLIRIARGFKL